MSSRLTRALPPLVAALLLGAALWVLHHELAAYRLHDIVAGFSRIPKGRLALALAFTALSYLLQTSYDGLGVRYAGHRLAYRRIALTSFIGYAFSNTVGHSLLTGGSVRFRLYSGWGLSTVAITRVIAFCTLTFWVGFLAMAGTVFVAEPAVLPARIPLPLGLRPLGVVFLALLSAYLAAAWIRRTPLVFRGWEFSLPSPRIAFSQVVVSALDWLTAAAALHVLLPEKGPGFAPFLGVFLFAQVAGLASQIPGGLGVFDTTLLLGLSGSLPGAEVASSLLAFRIVYYLAPLVVAVALLAAHELLQRREGVVRVARVFGRWAPQLTPNLLALTTFVGGAILLFSGATPGVKGRLHLLRGVVPLPLVEVSHLLASVTGAALLLLAWGLQRRLDAAYVLTAATLSGGIVFSLLKGFD